MTSNSQDMIQDLRAEFEKMIDFVTGDQARQATADQIERGLFKLLLKMGAKLLTLFFITRSQACSREPLQTVEGQRLGYHRDTKRVYGSIFGKMDVWRPYFYKTGLGGQSPLDAELSLGEDSYSDLVREISAYLSVYSVFLSTENRFFRTLDTVGEPPTRKKQKEFVFDKLRRQVYDARFQPRI
jgi:hypothetical protein